MGVPVLPPSPSPSCDSLDGIEDLDAYLEAMGPLSRFATPPPRSDSAIVITSLTSNAPTGFDTCPRELANAQAARLFTSATGTALMWRHEPMLNMLKRASLPPGVLALSYCILSECCHQQTKSTSDPSRLQRELRVVSCLALAQAYTSDFPRQKSWWAHHVCGDLITARQLNDAMLETLAALDWNLHPFTSPTRLQKALDWMLDGGAPATLSNECRTPLTMAISIDGATSSSWERGLLTPDGSPPPSAVEPAPHRFLPLL
ncbi:hypothetical protein M433DRAFT_156361 [Acidomyces richmondensis BFW]|nr:MAG: hypothetical protein FE78DRAFT_93216 [Acidomyces sp. 'richmondensis']KYG43752.1 hypothetical protein M433DRAFT_156361 [Acidomyces richmondensis BFW]